MKSTASLFKDAMIFFFENDSKDKTPQILSDIAANDASVVVISKQLDLRPAVEEGARSAGRFQRMADFRNELLHTIQSFERTFDVILFVDTDVYLGWETDGVGELTFDCYW